MKVNDFLRIGIQLRHQTSVQVKDLSQRIYYKEILLDKESREVNVNGVAVHLTGREFDLLKLFLEHPKKVFSRANLYETVWQEPYFDSEKTVNMLCIFIRCGEWGLDLIKWLLLLVVIFMGSFIFFLQREIKRLTKKIATLSERQEYGGRLSVEFREKNLMDLVDALNTWVDENEQKGQVFQEMEGNIRL